VQFSRIRFLGCTRFRAGLNRCQVTPCLLLPAGRLTHTDPVRHVRDEFPFRAACFRRDLPHVVSFPHLRVLCSIRFPSRIRWAFPLTVLLHLPAPCFTATLRFQHCSVSGFPLPCLKSCIPYTVIFHGQERLGPPKFFDASLPACHGLRTPADLHILAKTDALVLPSVCVKTLGVRNKRLFEAVPALQGARSPLRPTGFAVYASPILFAVSPRLRHGRKTRYGWMATPYPTGTFTLPETPSFLGAITPALRRSRRSPPIAACFTQSGASYRQAVSTSGRIPEGTASNRITSMLRLVSTFLVPGSMTHGEIRQAQRCRHRRSSPHSLRL
jgi:hypothetical protein